MLKYLIKRIIFRVHETILRIICLFSFNEFFTVKIRSTQKLMKFAGPYKRDIFLKYPTVIYRCFGIYEPETSLAIEKYVDKNDIFLELGCAYGYFSVQIARQAKEVHCVDPNKFCLNFCERNLKLNNLNNYKLYHDAIGDEIEINVWDGSKIKSKKLNNFLGVNKIKPTFIFIDCDSNEKVEHEFPILEMIIREFDNIKIILETKNKLKLESILKKNTKFKFNELSSRLFYIYTSES